MRLKELVNWWCYGDKSNIIQSDKRSNSMPNVATPNTCNLPEDLINDLNRIIKSIDITYGSLYHGGMSRGGWYHDEYIGIHYCYHDLFTRKNYETYEIEFMSDDMCVSVPMYSHTKYYSTKGALIKTETITGEQFVLSDFIKLLNYLYPIEQKYLTRVQEETRSMEACKLKHELEKLTHIKIAEQKIQQFRDKSS